MRVITCDRCGKRLSESEVHEVVIHLANAVPDAPIDHTKQRGDFCHTHAAQMFREFKRKLDREE